jgi:hypothetical protein
MYRCPAVSLFFAPMIDYFYVLNKNGLKNTISSV